MTAPPERRCRVRRRRESCWRRRATAGAGKDDIALAGSTCGAQIGDRFVGDGLRDDEDMAGAADRFPMSLVTLERCQPFAHDARQPDAALGADGIKVRAKAGSSETYGVACQGEVRGHGIAGIAGADDRDGSMRQR